MIKNIYFTTILFFVCNLFFSSCVYENAEIPNYEVLTIDTNITATDTAGYIWGSIKSSSQTKDILFQEYTVDVLSNTDSIVSFSTSSKNRRIAILLNDTTVGTYPVMTATTEAKQSTVIFFPSANNPASTVLFSSGSIVVTEIDTSLTYKIVKGTINANNGNSNNYYSFVGNFKFLVRNWY